MIAEVVLATVVGGIQLDSLRYPTIRISGGVAYGCRAAYRPAFDISQEEAVSFYHSVGAYVGPRLAVGADFHH